jgi:hypothetical protein
MGKAEGSETQVHVHLRSLALFQCNLILLCVSQCKWLNAIGQTTEYTIHTEWQQPISGVHSIMGVKSVQPGEGGGARPPPFTLSTITSKVVVYAPAERAGTLPLFLLYPYMYSVGQISAKTMVRVETKNACKKIRK